MSEDLLDLTDLQQSVEAICAEMDRLRAVRDELLASLRELVALYDGTRDLLGASVKAKLARAEAAIANAEVRMAMNRAER